MLVILCGVLSGEVGLADDNWFRLGQLEKRHHLVSPDGDRLFALGVNHINALSQLTYGGVQVRGRSAWETYWNDTLKPQFDDWHLTTLGYGAPVELRAKAPWFASIGLAPIEKHRSDPKSSSANGYQFPDVFDPEWASSVTARIVKVAGATRNDPMLVGYFWTDTPTWDLQKTRALRGTEWVSAIRNLPSDSPGRKAYASFLQERYSKRLKELNEYYGLDLPSLNELATASLDEIAIGRHVVQDDDNAFLGLIAKRFYKVVGSAQRQADPHHLVFGDRYLAGDAPVSVLKAAAPWIDAVAVQPGDRYSPLYPPSTAFPADEIEELHRITGKPVLICDHAISFPTQAQPRTIFEQMPDEASAAKATAEFLRRAFSRPYVIGYLRCQYIDRPARFGRGLRQGLVRPDGKPREVLVDAYRDAFFSATEQLKATGPSGETDKAAKE